MATKTTLLENVNLLIQEGIYEDQETLLQDALRALLRSKPELRIRMALALYKQEKISLAQASGIAGVEQENFKELLREAGISYSMKPVGKELENEVNQLMSLRDKKL